MRFVVTVTIDGEEVSKQRTTERELHAAVSGAVHMSYSEWRSAETGQLIDPPTLTVRVEPRAD